MNASTKVTLHTAVTPVITSEYVIQFVLADQKGWQAILSSYPNWKSAWENLSTAYYDERLDRDAKHRMSDGIKRAIKRESPAWVPAGFTLGFSSKNLELKLIGSKRGRQAREFPESPVSDTSQNSDDDTFETVSKSDTSDTFETVSKSGMQALAFDDRDYRIAAQARQIDAMKVELIRLQSELAATRSELADARYDLDIAQEKLESAPKRHSR